jgi:hypothetical protein
MIVYRRSLIARLLALQQIPQLVGRQPSLLEDGSQRLWFDDHASMTRHSDHPWLRLVLQVEVAAGLMVLVPTVASERP